MKEQELKQKILEVLQEQGWKYKPYCDLEKSPEEFVVKDVLFRKIKEINKDVELTEKDLNEVLARLVGGNRKEILWFLKNGVPVLLEKYSFRKIIKLIDYENLENNEFVVAEEVIFKRSNNVIKADLVLFVNGIPLVIIEVEERKEDEWRSGFYQLVNYFKKITQLFNIIQFGVVAADNIYYFPYDKEFENEKVEKLEEKKLYIWKPFEERKTKDWEKIFQATFSTLLNPSTLLEILKYFTFYKKNETKIIPRYYQYDTVKKIYAKIVERLENKSNEKSWTVWHYQGAGKTLVMIYLMYTIFKRLDRKLAPEPLVLFVVDRVELQEQILKDFINKLDLDLDIEPRIVTSFTELIEDILKSGERVVAGAYILLIQKFREQEKIESIPEKIKSKKDVFIFVDEAHRSHYGELNKRLTEMFKEAFYIAFTGTPLLKQDKNTFLKFGRPIDIYFIDEAEADGYVLPIYYKAVYDIIDLTLKSIDKKLYEELILKILKGEIDENLEEIDKEELEEKIKERIKQVRKLIFENDERIKEISKRVAKHFKNEVQRRGFKALLIAASRIAAIKYKRYLTDTKTNPLAFRDEEVEVVITYNPSEDYPEILEYFNEVLKRYKKGVIKDPDEVNKVIVEKFREEENPKILIVVNKLITGFDEPKIQTIYIDRFLSGHTLLQAIGRCNRKYGEIKKNGLIVDFVGIVDKLRQALELYYGEKEILKNQIDSIIKSAELIESRLNEVLEEIEKKILGEIGISLCVLKQEFERNLKEIIDDVVAKILSANLMKVFCRYFKEFEVTLFSPVASELKEEKYNEFIETYKILRVIYDTLNFSLEKKWEISEVDQIVDIKVRKILEKLYSETVIKEILESEKESFEKIVKALKNNNYLTIKEILENSTVPSRDERVNKEKLAKVVKTLTILRSERRELYESLIDTILKKIERYNREKVKAYTILREISKDIEKIVETEEVRASVGDDDIIFIYERLRSMLIIDKKRALSIAKDIRKSIKEAEKYVDRNDFCKILSKKIRIGVKKNLKDFPSEIVEKILSEIRRYYAGRYKECEVELLR